jgi:tRNA(Ile)-lysidine synthase
MEHVKRFFEKYWDQKSPLLFGYSGGSDSKALLYASLQTKLPIEIHIAHIDHGWRKESKEEALQIKEEMATLKLPFHLCQLTNAPFSELHARKERLLFFSSLFQKIPFQALILAHQQEDLLETCLKRVLEGAHLPFLGGMQPVGEIEGMQVFRPLLDTPKEEILTFLKTHNLTPFWDPTNHDLAFLRSRLRHEIVPNLRKSFGKTIDQNLTLLSQRAYELQNYLEEKIEKAKVFTIEEGILIFCAPFARLEQRYLLQKQAKSLGITWPRTLLESTLNWAEDPYVFRYASVGKWWIASGRGWVALLNQRLAPSFLRDVIDCKLGVYRKLVEESQTI